MMGAAAPVRLHPEATADPLALRWVADTSALTAPTSAMSGLIDDGTLAELVIGTGEIRTRLSPGRSWIQDGPRVRSVLFAALSEGTGGDSTVLNQISDVLSREVAAYVGSHGGDIEVVSLDDDTLTVRLSGTCGHCTLRSTTLRNVVANAVQPKFPQVRKVRATNA
ncbi:NifU family protein [Mycolicibacterium palauense]|uniref:NifU family protein n=1 Tax=Mycolicibacterium palauense TaxID=2034511 RepID=UPI001FEA34BE|nr:NifU family protein [Mycolicibacterium palauense]